ncbi:hypothetical protein EFK50_09295 [Nocardioides marmoriginsengisoli]|uniref:Lipoprotein n=1 Tax=Nocardioides marmoriginsengisoli TaxID=661483 RepID=A0A3N0CEY2_9ACTN|nr:hypothetical protein [Nocardioides marmoriginsengisoli]RNL62012.1 hypothetical protein EFK50_09295 [Nocardioides marmoriginsengisoli]
MKTVVWIVLALTLVSACSSEKDDAPAAGPRPSASPTLALPTSSVTVRPETPAWSTDEEVDGYRAAMKPVTSELDKLSAMSPDARIGRTRAALRAYSAASTEAVESLLQGKWGDRARGSVNTLIAALLEQQQYFDALANARDVAAIRARSDKTGQTLLVTRVCAAALEKDLGIGDGLLDLATRAAS